MEDVLKIKTEYVVFGVDNQGTHYAIGGIRKTKALAQRAVKLHKERAAQNPEAYAPYKRYIIRRRRVAITMWMDDEEII